MSWQRPTGELALFPGGARSTPQKPNANVATLPLLQGLSLPLLLSEMHRGGLLAAASMWEQRAQPHCLLPAGFISLQARQVSFVQHTAGVPLAAQQRLRCRLAALPAHTPVKRRGATREGRAELLLPSPGAPEARASSLRRGGSWLEEPPAPLTQRNPETAWG